MLLDTHVWLWWTYGSKERLPENVRSRIAQRDERVMVSMASLWEIAIKSRLGKIAFPRPPATYALKQMKRQRFELLGIRIAHVDAIASMPLHHRDPFDRLLIAQAQVEGLTLLTADAAFELYKIAKIIV
ncbi:MAG: type II toxin-antitoxin system VapC family toxin [Candidatus Eremiobacteraeota bacterium]|nr:type II toxin-antitoxin system VapC family toxin [Candidatus Eremiobacteraeota bacterium]MBC5802576.1 type II toxin-antitoxin system VapC family toxin [Candidatus Eremiobacteraeota bacterium]MBC5821851.1 type II toxin-antitoxin system VapC family toxin [Candidatus Eremiobacteraeota bacterium]